MLTDKERGILRGVGNTSLLALRHVVPGTAPASC